MSLAAYLPSTQFAVLVGSLVLSGGLVVGAQYVTKQPPTTLAVTEHAQDDEWQSALAEIQTSAGITLPEAPSPQTVGSLLAGVQSENLTDTLARSLFVSLTDAKARGLGDDIPTQEELVAQALVLAEKDTPTPYVRADLILVAQNQDSLRSYGNAMMSTFVAHPGANAGATLATVGQAIDYNDASLLKPLAAAQAEYRALARALVGLSVPDTLSPLHLQVANNLSAMAAAIGDMQALAPDPVRGLSGVQRFYALGNETSRVLTTIAGTFSKNGILFTKDEPGSAWSAFLDSSYTP